MRGDYVKLLKEFNADVVNRSTVDPKGKETSDIEKVSKVIVQLHAQKASAATKFASVLQNIVEQRKQLEELEKTTKEEARTWTEAFFQAGDEVWTRVVKTASIIVTLNKETERTTKSVDHEKLFKMVNELAPELQAQFKKILDECITVKKTVIASSIKVENKLENEGLGDSISATSKELVDFAKLVQEAAKRLGKDTLNATDIALKAIDKKIEAVDKFVGVGKN
jgi:hypothetical protein